ncbi:MAG TPA: Ppx/GppA phosphatase family protein [Candidatus Binatia bacterium]|nr:Ppx/GppA phosphatase family protein [Candidatus Binatia bacterium]
MPDHFAVIDAGSNALRLQIAAVDHPKRYRVLEQDRQSVRLGHDVFQTGKLNSGTVDAALKVLADFKATADRYRVKAIKAVGTSALREASDAKSFLKSAQKIGIPLEVLSEEEEARLISLGIMSGLRFHLPLGLFLDIGGGSVELAVANTTNIFCLFSLPLGAVRLTESFMTSDPPRHKEIRNLRDFVQDKLKPVVRRIEKEKFTMSFGSGGTVTALAETDTRVAGDTKAGSLSILRRSRLKALLGVLIGLPVTERASMISGDPKRADIIIAGGLVLHEIMSAIGLDYLFVSRRGLRDGLMIDLLKRQYSDSEPWHPDADRAESLEQVCQKYLYDAPHVQHVSQLAMNLFYQLHELHQLPERYAGILHAAAMLHDIGLFIAHPKHHKHSYYLIKSSGINSFNKVDLDLVANVARYHRKAHPSQKHLAFSQLSPNNQEVVRKLSALLRVADALDYKHEQRVQAVSCALPKSNSLTIAGSSAVNLKDEMDWAMQKGKLVQEVFNVNLVIQKAKTNRTR